MIKTALLALAGLALTTLSPGVTGAFPGIDSGPGPDLVVRDKEGNAAELPDAFIVIQGPDILAVSGRYTPEAASGEPAVSAN